MATSRDWSALGWTPDLSFALPTERQLAQSLMPDSGKGAESKFSTSAQNAALLQALGYGGNAFSQLPGTEETPSGGQVWSDDARNWLSQNGYNVGVAHDHNTTPGGRPEYFGLTGQDGKLVNGQSDPTMTMSDTMMDNIIPFLMMAGPFLSAAGAVGAGAEAGAGLGAAGEAGSGIGTLSGAADGVTSLGAGWSPAGLGLTGGIAPATSAAELVGLSSALPSAVEAGAGLGAAGSLGGGGGAAGSAAINTLPTQVITGTSAGAGGGITAGQAGGLLGATGATSSIGGSGGLSSADRAALYGNEGYGQGMTGGQTSVYDNLLNSTGSKGLADAVANSSLGGSLINGAGSLSDLVGGGQNLAALVGAGLGAASGGGTQTSSRDPWSAAQPYLKNLLGDADAMRANLQQNPFTPQQTQQYQQAYSGLDQARAALPGLLSWGQGAMQRQSTVPSYASLFGGGQPMQPQQPTAQAGGAGGLLGNDDRMKALMERGRGLMG